MLAKRAGTVTHVSAKKIEIKPDDQKNDLDIDTYDVIKFMRSNQGTCDQPKADCCPRPACGGARGDRGRSRHLQR